MSHFVRNGQRIDLIPSETTFCIEAVSASIATLLQALQGGEIEVLGADAEMGTVIVRSPGGRDALLRALRAAHLENQVFIGPSYWRENGDEQDLWAPTLRIVVQFPETWDRATVEHILARRSLTIVHELEDMPNTFAVRAHRGDPVELSCKLVEEDGALDAEPDFLRRFAPRRPLS